MRQSSMYCESKAESTKFETVLVNTIVQLRKDVIRIVPPRMHSLKVMCQEEVTVAIIFSTS